MTKYQYTGDPADYPSLGFSVTASGAILDGSLSTPAVAAPPDSRWAEYVGGSGETGIIRHATNPAAAETSPPEPFDGYVLRYSDNDNAYVPTSPGDFFVLPEVAAGVAALIAATTTNTVTNDYTLVLADAGRVVEVIKSTAVTVTIPSDAEVAWPAGAVLEVFQSDVGQVTVAAGAGVTITAPLGAKTSMQYGSLYLRKRATSTWLVTGDATT